MWSAYSAAIEKHVGSKLSDADALKLCGLLDRLGCSCDEPRRSPERRRAGAMILFLTIVFADAVRDLSRHRARSIETPYIRNSYGA